jgi:two-component system sensor histidine kinase BarA
MEQHHHAGDENLFVLLQADRFQIQLQRDVAQHIARRLSVIRDGDMMILRTPIVSESYSPDESPESDALLGSAGRWG